ncbi:MULTISPECIES: hypothetical protein [Halomonas]|uniref:hypothetical protein n=1 Tax=Halomonas TaxID=2745 RepID=UPI001C939897|nr:MULTISPECIES: hypothetical protein [Halomonas]MBY6208785.1 hypothetical protein [Halomonas sp. DP3Y7-2]MBY6227255.1 hypothetical protein [Halomonas sp. DP3Y7-1]MCA0914995.1 hypothetical protein [Halomonas denitrificans]
MKQRNPQLKIRLEPDVKAWLEAKAKTDERSQTWLLNHLAKEAMRREEQKTA